MNAEQIEGTMAETGLSPRAESEILRTFNSLTGRYATVDEYIAHDFPGSAVWGGDDCGCTDDRCTGHHHVSSAECGCLDVRLDEFHDDLATAYRMRAWLATQPDQAMAVRALEALYDYSRDLHYSNDLESRLDEAQRVSLDALFAHASHLDQDDYTRAVNRVGVGVLQAR